MQPIKTAIASYGMSGMVFHAPLLHVNRGYEIVSFLERSRENSKTRYPYARIETKFDNLCNDNSIELIIVNTPDHTHYELAKKAIMAGKHVVVEKPFTLKYYEAVELAELASFKGIILTVFQNRRWDGDFLTVSKVIGQKLLGRLVEYESHFDRYRNYIQPHTWKEDSSTGSGNLYNLGSHLIDQALVLFGKPEWVNADIRTMREGGMVDDSFEIWLGYNGIKVSLCSSYLVREPGPRFTLHGTDGSFLKWGIDPQEERLKQGELPDGVDWGRENEKEWGIINTALNGSQIRRKYETHPGNYNHFYDNLYNVIRKGDDPDVTPEQAALVIRIIEKAFESNKEGKAVKM